MQTFEIFSGMTAKEYRARGGILLSGIPDNASLLLRKGSGGQIEESWVIVGDLPESGKADNWEFEKYLPNAEDVGAEVKAMKKYSDLVKTERRCTIEDVLSAFSAGFWRGISWEKFRSKP